MKKVAVVISTSNKIRAEKLAKVLTRRADYPCEIFIAYKGGSYVEAMNRTILALPDYDYYVYLADDVFPSKGWLRESMEYLTKFDDVKLLAFNDGKWFGALAPFGIIEREYMQSLYGGNLFFPGYISHYEDTELTMIAKQDGIYSYVRDILMVEIDYDKEEKVTNVEDRKLFKRRKAEGFGGRVTSTAILNNYS
jgi:hypothetical protein